MPSVTQSATAADPFVGRRSANVMSPLARVVDALMVRGCRVRHLSPIKLRAQCPAHPDRRPSLSVTDVPGDKVLIHCFGRCGHDRVMAALHLKDSDLRHPPGPWVPRQVVADYAYHDADGHVVARKVRYTGKHFVWMRPSPTGGWTPGLNGLKPGLYTPGTTTHPDTVMVVESEKSADRLVALGQTAVAGPSGANKWRDEWSTAIWATGATLVVVLPDTDTPGRRHAAAVAASLWRTRPDRPVTITLPELPGLPVGADVFDYVQDRPVYDLMALIAVTDPWQPVDPVARARELTRLRVRRFRERQRAAKRSIPPSLVPDQSPVTLCKRSSIREDLSIERSLIDTSFLLRRDLLHAALPLPALEMADGPVTPTVKDAPHEIRAPTLDITPDADGLCRPARGRRRRRVSGWRCRPDTVRRRRGRPLAGC